MSDSTAEKDQIEGSSSDENESDEEVAPKITPISQTTDKNDHETSTSITKQSTSRPKSKSAPDDDNVEEFDTDDEETTQTDNKESSTEPDYTKHYSYEGSDCIYTDPTTGTQSVWNVEDNKWVPRSSAGDTTNTKSTAEESTENGDPNANGAATAGVYGYEGDTHTYTDPSDGSVYIWDREKNAWFPKVDDDFLARYQMSYGFTDASAVSKPDPAPPEPPQPKLDKEQRKAEAKRKAQEAPVWFEVDEAHNTSVYITGLPLDVTMEELKEMVTKYGLLARDDKAKDKIKLYKDAEGQPKGDALVTYIKVESVDLALHLLDGLQVRGQTLSVQRAKFQMKGAYDPALKPKRKKKDKERAKKVHEKLFDWRPERMRGEPQKCERVVILKNLFTPDEFDKDVTLILEYQQDLRTECSKCGEVKKVVVYDRHPEGVAQITFKEPAEAEACVQLMNGRWFAQKRLTAEIWDGKTKYKIFETDAEIEARLAKWDKFLDDEDEKKEAEKKATEEKEKTT